MTNTRNTHGIREWERRDVMYVDGCVIIAWDRNDSVQFEFVFDFANGIAMTYTIRRDMSFDAQRVIFEDNDIAPHIIDAIGMYMD